MRPGENPGAHQKAGISHTWMCLDWKRRGIIPSEKHCREMELLGHSLEDRWTKGFLSTKATMLIFCFVGFNESVSFLKDKWDYKNVLDSDTYFSSWQKKKKAWKDQNTQRGHNNCVNNWHVFPGFSVTLQMGTVLTCLIYNKINVHHISLPLVTQLSLLDLQNSLSHEFTCALTPGVRFETWEENMLQLIVPTNSHGHPQWRSDLGSETPINI